MKARREWEAIVECLASPGGTMASKSGRTADLTSRDLVAMFSDEPRTRHLDTGQVLFKNDDPAASMFVVRSGTLRIRSGSVVYEDVGAGGIVGEMGIIESNMPRSAMVYALTPAELVEVDQDRFLTLVDETPSFALSVMRVLSRRLRRMDDRYEARVSDDIH
jgi:CRP/FNR family transcriptional regulator, cyclic AMP receptor protein